MIEIKYKCMIAFKDYNRKGDLFQDKDYVKKIKTTMLLKQLNEKYLRLRDIPKLNLNKKNLKTSSKMLKIAVNPDKDLYLATRKREKLMDIEYY